MNEQQCKIHNVPLKDILNYPHFMPTGKLYCPECAKAMVMEKSKETTMTDAVTKKAISLLWRIEKMRLEFPECRTWTQPIYETLVYLVANQTCEWIDEILES